MLPSQHCTLAARCCSAACERCWALYRAASFLTLAADVGPARPRRAVPHSYAPFVTLFRRRMVIVPISRPGTVPVTGAPAAGTTALRAGTTRAFPYK